MIYNSTVAAEHRRTEAISRWVVVGNRRTNMLSYKNENTYRIAKKLPVTLLQPHHTPPILLTILGQLRGSF